MKLFWQLLLIQSFILSASTAIASEKVVVIPLWSTVRVNAFEGEFIGKTDQGGNIYLSVHNGTIKWEFAATLTGPLCTYSGTYAYSCTGTDFFDCAVVANNGYGLSGTYDKLSDSWAGSWYAKSDACIAMADGTYNVNRVTNCASQLFECENKLAGCLPTCSGILNGTRWCDNLDGTVTDMTTGLVWLKNADCFGPKNWINTDTWDDALTAAGTLRSGKCGLIDGSVVGDWTLPTINELYGLANGVEAVRHSTPRAFINVQGYFYSSTTDEVSSQLVRCLYDNGIVGSSTKDETFNTWPVRRIRN